MDAIRRILVHLDGPARANERLLLARRLAQGHGAQLDVLFAATPLTVLVPYPAAAGAAMARTLAELDEERRAGARAAFQSCLGDSGLNALWCEATELDAEAVFANQARCADLLVMGQSDPTQIATGGVQSGFPERVLVQSGRPGLLVPFAGTPAEAFETVTVAWKDTPEAARAVAGALPLLRTARQVHVLAWDWEPATLRAGTVMDPAGWLRLHGVAAQWHAEGPEPHDGIGELILSRCADLGADLLVMGCYGRSRAREWLLGGASRTLLGSMTLPVLMSH